MTGLMPLTISIGLLAGVATWIFLSIGTILIWAAFAAWACYFHNGGDNAALKSTIICNIFGVIVAWIAAIIILAIPLAESLTLPVWAAIVVAVTVAIYTKMADIPVLSSIPATTYGYACAFAFLLQTPDKLSLGNLTSPSFNNVLVVVIVSMVIGALFGMVTGKFAAALTKE